MFGPALETFRVNKITLTAVVIFGLLPALYLIGQEDPFNLEALGIVALFMAPFAAAVIWLSSVQLTFHEEGFAYRSLLGSKQMRWDQVEKFYYSSVKQSINFIPIGTYYTFKLIDSAGQKIKFGNRFERLKELADKLIEHTYQPLLKKTAEQFDSGIELDFGSIRVSREKGIKVKKTFRWKEYPWDQVASYAINDGQVYIWPAGKKYVNGSALAEVPNAFVLIGLLDALFQPEGEKQ